MEDKFANMLSFLKQLQEASIHYRLDHIRDDSLLVSVCVPGERWEIEFMNDGSIEIEIFRSDGTTMDKSALDNLFRDFSD